MQNLFNRTRGRWRLALLLLLMGLAGCGRSYPEMVDRSGIELLAALRTACNTQSPERLARVAEKIAEHHQNGTLNDDHFKAFEAIIALAESGEWKQAEECCFAFQQAQVR